MVREFKTFTTAANRHLLKTNFPPCTSSRGSISKAGWEHFLLWIGDFPIKMAKINVFTLYKFTTCASAMLENNSYNYVAYINVIYNFRVISK